MIDTLKLRSPALTEGEASAIAMACERRSAVSLRTGELRYSLTTGNLEGTWDTRISVRVMIEEWRGRPGARPVLVGCAPYVFVEGSVHKALCGHNVSGGPCEMVSACTWLVGDLGRRIGCDLPDGTEWEPYRVDWAECYDVGSAAAVREYIDGLNHAHYPRRRVDRYGSECIFTPGMTTTVKIYHKGAEFRKHDYQRCREVMRWSELSDLQERADRILRAEVGIHRLKITEKHGSECRIGHVDRGWLEQVHDDEIGKLLREGKSEMEIVRTHKEVQARLIAVYGKRRGGALFGTWMQLAVCGDAATRSHLSRTTFYRHRSELTSAGCSWLATDVVLRPVNSAIPLGFSPTRQDCRRLVGVDERVRRQLERLPVAA